MLISIQYNLIETLVRMMTVCEYADYGNQPQGKMEIGTTLLVLQNLKTKISELRIQCEDLKKLHSETKSNTLLCSHCASPVIKSQAIGVKDSFGKEKSFFHNECFRALWRDTDT